MPLRLPANNPLLANLQGLRGIIDALPHPIFVKDDEYRFVVANRMMCGLMGQSFYDMISRTDYDFLSKEQADIFRSKDQAVLETGETNENEELLTGADGQPRTVITRKKRLTLPDGKRFIVGCITDISDFRRAEAQIRYNAEHDHLTGVGNRALFRDRLQELIAAEGEGSATALLLIDLDGFKHVNDAFGHAAGDELLVQTASRLAGLVGPNDLVARLGGDEFAILQRAVEQPAAATTLAASVIGSLSKPIFLSHAQANISASVGIADLTAGMVDRETLMHRADLALYGAKEDGRSTWRRFEPAMEVSHLLTRFLDDDLRLAVERRQFSLVFQPFVDAGSLEIVGFEALLRWRHPSRGDVEPSLFVPVAERTGAIAALGEWVLRAACAEAAGWPEPLRVAVNVSPVQFAQVDLPALVRSVVAETGIDPPRLDLEITETAVIKDVPAARRIFAALRDLGVKVVLDDFGAGYSSLQILKSLPFDKIKIDRSLLNDVSRSKQADAIIGAILRLTRILGLQVTVEGVETEEQLAVLKHEPCDELQGFLLGRPATIAAYQATILGGLAEKRA